MVVLKCCKYSACTLFNSQISVCNEFLCAALLKNKRRVENLTGQPKL